jgi:Mitochondrial 18 KDa protein (MTP18)
MLHMYVVGPKCFTSPQVHWKQTSDVGEAFRPVVPPWVVTAAYGVSWIYLAG